MGSFNPKDLKKLADMCRKAGIKHFKNADFEFTLTDSVPEKKTRGNKKAHHGITNDVIPSDGLSQDELMFWSSDPNSSVGANEGI